MSAYRAFLDFEVTGQVTFLGDLHGKLETLEAILAEREVEVGLRAGAHTVISVGDVVDRGPLEESADGTFNRGAEAVLDRLQSLKQRHPTRVHVLLGNHEQQHLLDIRERRLGPGDVSQWGAQGKLRLTPSRLAFLGQLPVSVRVTAALTTVLVVHGGPTRAPFDLSCAELAEGASSASEHRWNQLVWSNPSWSLRAGEGGPLFTPDHVRLFLEANRASLLIRGHRDEDELRDLGTVQFMTVHSAKGPRHLDDVRYGYSFAVWDPPARPSLVRRPPVAR